MLQGSKLLASAFVLGALFISGCAKERPVKTILNNGRRLPKTTFQGSFLFQKTITDVKYAGNSTEGTPIGSYEISNKLIQFEAREKTLDIVAIDPLFKDEKAALRSTLLASFPIKHVDVLRKQNSEGQDTHEEEETENRRPWKQRELVVIDPTHDSQDRNSTESTYAATPDSIDIDPATGSINIDVTYQLKDETQVSLKYSFLPYRPSETYIPKPYPEELALRFGLFNTMTLSFDKYGRVLETEAKKSSVMNRWDTSKTVVYYLSKDFPDHLKPAAQKVFSEWNKLFEASVGRKVLELRENSGQQLGDLRYNMIHYDPSIDASHGILGYGPSYTNPRTGEIIKADVILYGGVLKSSTSKERTWTKVLSGAQQPVAAETMFSTKSAAQLPKESLKIEDARQIKSQIKSANLDLVSMVSKKYNPISMLSKTRESILRESKKNMTRISEDFMAEISKGSAANMSDEELELAIFTPLLTHELGHNLGLRHNFMASTDKNHFSNNAKSSSVMDYGFFSSEEPIVPGPYDAATIQVAYGQSETKVKELINENYYYCSDEEVMSSTHGMCHQFDSGSSLPEVVQSQFNRYMGSWAFNNLRNDRIFFNGPDSTANYLGRVQSYLTPLRLIYDHSDAILRAAEENSFDSLWILLRQRIEADKSSSPENIKEVSILQNIFLNETNSSTNIGKSTLTRKIDLSKIPLLVKEASQAKTLAYQALMTVILNSTRPDYNTLNSLTGEIQMRGVIYDKMIALLLAGGQTSDPLGGNTGISLFSSTEGGEFRSLLISLLSDTASTENDSSTQSSIEISPSDANLREIALEIVTNELATPGNNAYSRRLLNVNQMQLEKTSLILTAEAPYREKARALYKQLFQGNLTDEEAAAIKGKLQINQLERNKACTLAVTPAFIEGNLYFVSPLSVPDLNIETAAGHLIRNNLNVLEDMIEALKLLLIENRTAIDSEMKKLEGERDSQKVMESLGRIEKLQQMLSSLNQFAENERLFLEKFFQQFNGK